ncbi:hypothetical protein K443DRAFT_339931 [Laccaria amethystina LaAM-08-1]|uniref:Uncharacterized protein n=1 Tax=Laccaria amethystina LaAM-08-1 TaxID=1095629 RepID=A0A0C9XBC5_9AGAR|nr:hypothetical protein K443DRAFT_339931 [Laccaria amethystina LaAM-08-1]
MPGNQCGVSQVYPARDLSFTKTRLRHRPCIKRWIVIDTVENGLLSPHPPESPLYPRSVARMRQSLSLPKEPSWNFQSNPS